MSGRKNDVDLNDEFVLQIINAANQSVHGFVATASHPTKIAWVPSRFGNPPVAASSVGRG